MEDQAVMADKEEGAPKRRGWLKPLLAVGGMIFGTLGGLLSGVCVAYFTPIVDRAVKPPKPVANFRVEQDGLTVRFHNLAPGFAGWWDFGDGAELVPVTAGQDAVPHAYPRPGDYTAKMTLANALGEEDERSVTLHIAGQDDDAAPQVEDLQAVPVSPGSYAPATFRVVGKTSHARLCVWYLGDERPMEVVNDAPASQERLVYFQKPGDYALKLAAVNGAQQHQKSLVVSVRQPPEGSVGVVLTATDSGAHVKTNKLGRMLTGAVDPAAPPGKPAPFKCEFAADPGWTIADMQWKQGGRDASLGDKTKLDIPPAELGLKNVKDLHLEASPDRRKVVVTGTMMRPAGNGSGWESSFGLPVTLVEKQSAPETKATTMTATVTVPAAGGPAAGAVAVPPTPADWVDVKRALQVELRDGRGAKAATLPVPGNASITVQNRRYTVSARQDNNQVRVDFVDGGKVGE
jgi:PKD repeat protein